jgi:hypothetical protein
VRIKLLLAAVTGSALTALCVTASTVAIFSDFATVPDQRVGAGTVVIGGAENEPASLEYTELLPGVQKTSSLVVSYSGSIQADLYLDVEPTGSSFCTSAGAPLTGGELQISLDGTTWKQYCALTGQRDLLLASGVDTGEDVSTDVLLRLSPDTDYRYSELASVDDLTVRAVQSGGSGSFTDYAAGTLSVSSGRIVPATPAECLVGGDDPYPADRVYVLTDENDDFSTPAQPTAQALGYLVFALGGDDHITGSNGRDCIVGGDGDDELSGGNQDDVLVGGVGDDQLQDDEFGEDPHVQNATGQDRMFGGDGNDRLRGGNGKDALWGGDGVDDCVRDTSPADDVEGCENEALPDGGTVPWVHRELLVPLSLSPAETTADEPQADVKQQTDTAKESEAAPLVEPSPTTAPTPAPSTPVSEDVVDPQTTESSPELTTEPTETVTTAPTQTAPEPTTAPTSG